MIPSNSGGSSAAGCNPISSNCVIWQGPDIPCINLCAGDSISNVLAHLAEMMCALQPAGDAACCDVSLIDPGCLELFYKEQTGENIPDDWVLQDYINLLIEYVCQLNTGGGGTPILPSMPIPKCLDRNGDWNLYLNGSIVTGDTMELVSGSNTYTVQNDGSAAGAIFGGAYNGWAEMVVEAICNLAACCHQHDEGFGAGEPGGFVPSEGQPVGSGIKPALGSGTRPMTKDWVNKLIDQKFTKLSTSLRYIPKKVVPKFVTNKIGRPVAMEVMLTSLEREFGTLRGMTGTALQLRDAITKQCMNLNTEDRLAGKGTFGTMKGWHLAPANLAESHANQWSVICDVTNAIRDIQQNHLGNVTCKDIEYNVNAQLLGVSGTADGIGLDFTGTVVKAPFKDTDPVGSKITVVDSSLTTITKYIPIGQWQNRQGLYNIPFASSGMDRTSNYQITIDFSFSDGTSVCARTMTLTVENEVACPEISFSNITGSSFQYNAVFTPSYPKDATVAIICESVSGTEIGRNIYTQENKLLAGTFGSLQGGQSYHVYAKITSKAGNVTSCKQNLVTTLVPSCSSSSILSAEYGSDYLDLQGSRIELGVYNDGANTWTTTCGFDKDGVFKVCKSSDYPGSTATAGVSITTYGTFTSNDPSLSIVCGGTTYVSGLPSSASKSGWQYVNTFNGPNNNPYYIYALVNTSTNSIDQVVACCDCKAVYIKRHNSMNYCVTGKTTDIKIDVAGFVSGIEKPIWSLASTPTYGNAWLNTIKSTAEEVVYTYQSTRSTSDWTSDSFTIRVENNCGTSNDLIIPITKGETIGRTDTDVTVFVDTCTMTYTDAALLKESFEKVKTSIRNVCSTWSGTINYVPVDSSGDSGNYINHAKAMIDMKSGATGSITVATGTSWGAWKSLPAHWDAGYKGSVPTSTYIFSFVSSLTDSCGNYGEDSLSAGFGAQPKVSYQQNYDELLDIVNGTTTTSWGGQMNSTQPGWGFPIFGTTSDKTKYFTQVIMPIISDNGSTTAAASLQIAGALFGNVINTAEVRGLKVGNIQYPVNLGPWMENGVAPLPVPYNVNTPVGNNMKGLNNYGYIPSFWFENGNNLGTSNDDLRVTLLSIFGLNETSTGYNCTSSTPTAKRMKDPSGRDTYATGATCANASAAALSSHNPQVIYNTSGLVFDTTAGSTLAFKTAQGCQEGHDSTTAINDEIASGWYGVVAGVNGYQIAEYTQGSGWSNHQCMDGAGLCKVC